MRTAPDADELGTALAEVLPWLRAIDELADAVQDLLYDQGSKAELARACDNYHETARVVLGLPEPPDAPEGKGTAYEGLSKLRYRG